MRDETIYYWARPFHEPPLIQEISNHGEGDVFSSRAEAVGYVRAQLEAGIRAHEWRRQWAERRLEEFCKSEGIEL